MEMLSAGAELAVAMPWRFDSPDIVFTAAGQVVPAMRYRSLAELLASAIPKNVHWRLSSR
jgi:hypothetical protein